MSRLQPLTLHTLHPQRRKGVFIPSAVEESLFTFAQTPPNFNY